MTMKRWDGGLFVDTSIQKRWDGANWVDLTIARRWDGANWIDIAFPGGGGGVLSATISTNFVFGNVLVVEPAPLFKNIHTSEATITATGGTGPYTYFWQRISGDSAIIPVSTTSATISFTANAPKNQPLEAVWVCTITDSVLATFQVAVTANIMYENGL